MFGSTTTIGVAATAFCALLASFSQAVAEEAYDCLIEPNMVVDISSSVDGVVQKVYVDRSDSVEKGQLLVELESGVEIAAVNKARARSKMTGDLESRKSSLEYAQRRVERLSKLFKKGLVSSNDLDEAETQERLAQAELNKAQDEQQLAQLELQRAEEALKLRRIRAPFAGVVMERYKSPGESVEDKPILKLAQLDPLRVELYMPATDFGEIKPGRYAQVTPETSGADYHLAEVKLVDRVIDAASGTFNVRLEIPNPDHKIPGGLRCKLQFLSESESARIRDQRSGLQHESAGEFDAGESPSDSSQAAYESPVIMSGLGQ
jgi:RND family efflux transporter MFP subunit